MTSTRFWRRAVNVVPLVVVPAAFLLLWGIPDPKDHLFGFVVALGLLALLAPAHEVVHAVGHRWVGRLRWDDIDWSWKEVAAKAPETLCAYRWAVILPFICVGIVPAVAGLVSGSVALAILGMVGLSSAGNDVSAFIALKKVPAGAIVQDRPRGDLGCDVWFA